MPAIRLLKIFFEGWRILIEIVKEFIVCHCAEKVAHCLKFFQQLCISCHVLTHCRSVTRCGLLRIVYTLTHFAVNLDPVNTGDSFDIILQYITFCLIHLSCAPRLPSRGYKTGISQAQQSAFYPVRSQFFVEIEKMGYSSRFPTGQYWIV